MRYRCPPEPEDRRQAGSTVLQRRLMRSCSGCLPWVGQQPAAAWAAAVRLAGMFACGCAADGAADVSATPPGLAARVCSWDAGWSKDIATRLAGWRTNLLVQVEPSRRATAAGSSEHPGCPGRRGYAGRACQCCLARGSGAGGPGLELRARRKGRYPT